MNRTKYIVLCMAVVAMTGIAVRAGDIVDRIVATVNGHVILQSDWDDAILYESFIAARPLESVTVADRKAALDHLIDQELLREQIHASESVNPATEEVQGQVEQIRQQYKDVHSDAEWDALLSSYRLSQSLLRNRIMVQLELSHLVDVRLRPAANVNTQSIESYYRQELLPHLQQSGQKEVSLADVSPKIKELLTQEKISELLVGWLEDLHAGSEIRTWLSSPAGESQAQ